MTKLRWALMTLWLVLLLPISTDATPLYAARSPRTCDNCHSLPNTWENPEMMWRKCNLSCMTCHIDPLGGGMRNVSGRFFAESTLPMTLASFRGYKDRKRWPFGNKLDGKLVHKSPQLAWGKPIGDPSKMAYLDDRYYGLNADPLLQVGLDARLAAWVTGESATVFPMQLDTHAAVHPLPYLTLHTTAGVLAKAKGIGATLERESVFAVKDVVAMVHQLPYMAYARAGRFAPPFGMRTEDHTSFVRREFEQDLSSQHSRVVGAEVGFAPNYPYAHLAVFRPNQADVLDGADPLNDRDPPWLGVPGVGMAASAGWRDLAWGAGASFMTKSRDLIDGGNTVAGSLQGQFNPWRWSDYIPLTFLGEFALGTRQRPISGVSALHYAAMGEADWSVMNGLNLRAKYDFVDPDVEVSDDHVHRIGSGVDWHPIPNVTLTMQTRWGIPASGGGDMIPDIIMFLRGWL